MLKECKFLYPKLGSNAVYVVFCDNEVFCVVNDYDAMMDEIEALSRLVNKEVSGMKVDLEKYRHGKNK